MSSATGLCGVVDEGAGGAAELVVEHHGGSEGGESGAEACAEGRGGSGAVSLECEDGLAGPEDRFDPLADRREVRVVGFAGRAGVWGDQRRRPRYRGAQRRPGRGGVAAFLVCASGSGDRCVQLAQFGLEVLAAEVLIADQEQHLPAGSFAAGEHLQAHELLVDLRGGQRQRSRGAVQGEQGVQAKPVEVAAVAGGGTPNRGGGGGGGGGRGGPPPPRRGRGGGVGRAPPRKRGGWGGGRDGPGPPRRLGAAGGGGAPPGVGPPR